MRDVCLQIGEMQHIKKVRVGKFIDWVEETLPQTEDEDTWKETVG